MSDPTAVDLHPRPVRRADRPERFPGLRALAHPTTIAAVVLLALNDHVLKASAPGPLTGKLSDVAGLFFFPILVAFCLGVLARRWSARKVGMTAFLTCATLFALIKAHPGINASVRGLAVSALGMRLQLALDPSDLWALAVLPPGFLLWVHTEERAVRHVPVRRALLTAGFASLAAIATSCLPQDPVGWLIERPEGIYAVEQHWQAWGSVYRSTNAGREWEYVLAEDEPEDLGAWVSAAAEAPLVTCVRQDASICYRIDGVNAVVEASGDGGQAWEVAWRPPEARLSYMRRVAAGSGLLQLCPGKDLDMTPRAMVVVGEGAGHIALIALGNEGVLRGRAGGTWERIGVGSSEPTPERATSLAEVWFSPVIQTETLLLILCGVVSLPVLSGIARSNLPRRSDAFRQRYSWIWGIAAGILFVAILVSLLEAGPSILIAYVVVPFAIVLAYLAWQTQQWAIAIRDGQDRRAALRALGLSLAGSWGSVVLAWSPLALWLLGVIPWYALALVLSVVLLALPMFAVGRALGRPTGPVDTGREG